jgi:hypothetical protein
MNDIPSRVPLTVSEAQWQQVLIDTARLYRWTLCHIRPARTDRGWRTPIEGDAGLPDLILARDGVVLLVEVKRQQGQTSPAQRRWLAALGAYGRCWKPSDWNEALRTLRDGPDQRETA